MKRTNKKGFTIVELVIVIAVIAILAAVLIPNISRLVRKAQVSNDLSLVRNLNMALETESATMDYPTAYSAFQAVKENGYDIAKIEAKASNNQILYDEVNKCFAYLNGGKLEYYPNSTKSDKVTPAYQLWAVYTDQTKAEASNYSVYWNGATAFNGTVKAGFDAGENTNVKTVNYTSNATQNVIIRTNGGEVTVNAELSTVKHYGKADSVTINAVASNSYHEYGEVVGDIVITKGRIELAATAQVGTVFVASVATGDVKVDVVSGAQVGTVAPTTVNAKADINASNTIPEESRFKGEGTVTVSSDFAGGLGTERSPYLIANEKQFSNINNLYSEKKEYETYNGETYYFQQIADIKFKELSAIRAFTGTYDGNNKIISFNESVKSESTGLFQFVFDKTIIKNINYQLKKNQAISLVHRNDYYADTCDLTFQNIEIDSNGETIVANGTNFGFFAQFTCFNISKVRYENCVNNANLNNSGTSTGVFLGSGWQVQKEVTEKIEYINCKNTGHITGTSNVGVLYGNGAYVGSYDKKGDNKVEEEYSENNFVIENVENTGNITSVLPNGTASVAPKSKLFDDKVTKGGTFTVGGCFGGKTVKVDLSNGNAMKFSVDGSSEGITYKIAFNINCILNEDGKTESNTTKYFFDIKKDNSVTSNVLTSSYVANSEEKAKTNGITDTSNLKYNNEGIAVVVQSDKTILVFKDGSIGDRKLGEDGSGFSTVAVYLYAYDNDGLCIGVYRVK